MKLVSVHKLKGHEKTRPFRLRQVRKQILASKRVHAVVVDRKTHTVLDGHHRLHVLRKLGAKKIPARLVNLGALALTVESRRKYVRVSKALVVLRAAKKKLYPPKTTKHLWKKKQVSHLTENDVVSLKELM